MRKTIMVLATTLSLSLSSLSSLAQSAMVDGEVMKVDESAGKITIKHGQ
jgi:Cu(I)/Ag(I) efflux system protein CusF